MELFISSSIPLWFTTSGSAVAVAVIDENGITSAMSQSEDPPSSPIISTHALVTLSTKARHSPLEHPF
jgi:hypothetical protein